jgi:hypothetical protein
MSSPSVIDSLVPAVTAANLQWKRHKTWARMKYLRFRHNYRKTGNSSSWSFSQKMLETQTTTQTGSLNSLSWETDWPETLDLIYWHNVSWRWCDKRTQWRSWQLKCGWWG